MSGLELAQPKIGSRIKERDGCIKKFEIKYRDRLERDGLDYSIEDHISDLIGIRIVCLYESDIVEVAALIRQEFDIIEITDKTDVLVKEPRAFGYKGLHIDAKLNAQRLAYQEYKNFANIKFEIQVRTIAQDAWSEIDHKLKYKRQTTPILQRRIIRLAALFELADQEF